MAVISKKVRKSLLGFNTWEPKLTNGENQEREINIINSATKAYSAVIGTFFQEDRNNKKDVSLSKYYRRNFEIWQ